MSDMPSTRRAFLAAGACCCCCAALPAFATVSGEDFGPGGFPQALEIGSQPARRIAKTVWVREVAPKLWLHCTTAQIAGGAWYPANGLVLERAEGSVMIDTAWSPEQAAQIYDWAKAELAGPITLAVATHFHNDRTGGIDGLKARGVRTLASPLTCELARAHQQPTPEPIAKFGAAPYRLVAGCELFFPGAGHTRDNIVAWFPEQDVLFGGCFIKSTTSPNLGNVADADVSAWAANVHRMQDQYPKAKMTVPGHGEISGDTAAWTLALLATAGH